MVSQGILPPDGQIGDEVESSCFDTEMERLDEYLKDINENNSLDKYLKNEVKNQNLEKKENKIKDESKEDEELLNNIIEPDKSFDLDNIDFSEIEARSISTLLRKYDKNLFKK